MEGDGEPKLRAKGEEGVENEEDRKRKWLSPTLSLLSVGCVVAVVMAIRIKNS